MLAAGSTRIAQALALRAATARIMVIVIDRKRVAEGFPRTLDDHRPHEVSMLHPDEQQRRPSRQAFRGERKARQSEMLGAIGRPSMLLKLTVSFIPSTTSSFGSTFVIGSAELSGWMMY